ncbi:MAG: hypothetical protein RRX93_03420 [Bacteroidales bacterium]
MKKFTSFFKLILPDTLAICIFLLLAIVYCSPMLKGNILMQHDVASWQGMAKEANDYRAATGHQTGWTNSMFSGMPTLQIAYQLPAETLKIPLIGLFRLWLPETLAIIFSYLLCFYVLFRVFRLNPYLSIIAAIATSFSSYFFIIIQAGHVTKAFAIANSALILAGTELIFRKKTLWGIFLMAIGSSFAMPNHPQMMYYYLLAIGIYIVCRGIQYIREKNIKQYVYSLLFIISGFAIGLGTNLSFYKTNNEYVKETMRGGHSELDTSAVKYGQSKGLDIDYATQWSYGIDETFTLLIPNFKGGSSNNQLDNNSHLFKALSSNGVPNREAAQYCQNSPTYWGTQPFTSGPTYIGAIVVFLFFFGLFSIKGPIKWALLIATIFSFALSWGRNFMPLTEFFMDYFPFYNQFRAVSSILVVAEVCMPLLAFLGLNYLLDPTKNKIKNIANLKLSFYITGGICLFVIILGSVVYTFASPNDTSIFANLPTWYYDAILADRSSMLIHDALRSLVFIVLSFGVIYYYIKGRLKLVPFYVLLGVLITIDLWSIDKRYFNDSHFVQKQQYKKEFMMSDVDRLILQDTDPHYRVFNVSTNTFNDAKTSYFHKSVGGYSAVKLRRYQDIIERHLSKPNVKVLNMLNTKYFIVPASDGVPQVQRNASALGNAWFIDTLIYVKTPIEEIDALNIIDPATCAVVNSKFSKILPKTIQAADSASKSIITLTSYAPNKLNYKAFIKQKQGVAVFSEVYYSHGWKAFIDGKETEHFYVNYILRALVVPAGEHEITFLYESDTEKKWSKISIAFVTLLYVLLFAAMANSINRMYVKNNKIK